MVPKTVRSETPSIAEAAVDGDCVTASEVFDDHVEHGNLEMGSCSAGVVSKESSRPNGSRLSCGALNKEVSFNTLRAPPLLALVRRPGQRGGAALTASRTCVGGRHCHGRRPWAGTISITPTPV